MHTGWSAICSLGTVYVAYMEKPKGSKGWLVVAASFLLTIWYPLLTIYTIVVTGNHFWLDALGGLGYVAVAFVIARLWLMDFGRMYRLESVVYGEDGYEGYSDSKSNDTDGTKGETDEEVASIDSVV